MALIETDEWFFESDYLIFERDSIREEGKKTQFWIVTSKRSREVLGRVQWYGPWRQYCFWPEGNTIWNTTCLEDIQDLLQILKDARLSAQRASA